MVFLKGKDCFLAGKDELMQGGKLALLVLKLNYLLLSEENLD